MPVVLIVAGLLVAVGVVFMVIGPAAATGADGKPVPAITGDGKVETPPVTAAEVEAWLTSHGKSPASDPAPPSTSGKSFTDAESAAQAFAWASDWVNRAERVAANLQSASERALSVLTGTKRDIFEGDAVRHSGFYGSDVFNMVARGVAKRLIEARRLRTAHERLAPIARDARAAFDALPGEADQKVSDFAGLSRLYNLCRDPDALEVPGSTRLSEDEALTIGRPVLDAWLRELAAALAK